MAKPLSPIQSWLLLLGVAAVFAVLVLTHQHVYGILLVVAVVMGLAVRLLWQAITERPTDSEMVTRAKTAIPEFWDAPGPAEGSTIGSFVRGALWFIVTIAGLILSILGAVANMGG